MNEDIKKVFYRAPMLCYRSPRNPSSYLVRAKLYLIEGKQDLVNRRVAGIRYASMYLKRKRLLA